MFEKATSPHRFDRPGIRKRVPNAAVVPALSVVLVALAVLTPKFTADPYLLSFVPTTLVLLLAAMHVWLMLRVNLLSFASPPFMAIGGYVVALLAVHVSSNAVLLVVACFLVPALLALPLGVVLLRLRGTYFALVTFVLAQVIILLIIIVKGPLGGSSGISGIPAATLGSKTYAAGGDLLRFSVVVGVVGLLIAAVVSVVWRRHFAALEENEPLASSLGLRPWLYKTLSFMTAAGVAGLAGLVLVNQLGNAQPDSFQPFSAVNHVAAAVIGGPFFLGPIAGALLLSWLVHAFASQAQYSQLLLGAALIIVVLFARGGITGLIADGARLIRRFGRAGPGNQPEAEQPRRAEFATTGASSKDSEKRGRTIVGPVEIVLKVEGLCKRFGGVAAVDDISLELRKGDVLGVIGPNGAGKTTLINMISGAMAPTDGTVTLSGENVTSSSLHKMSRQGIARSYQQTSVFSLATVRENLARAKAFSKRWVTNDELDELLRLTGLDGRLDDRAGDLPYGLQKLLGLLLPLATRPMVLLLDEPAAGLELSERDRIDELVDWVVGRGSSVLLVEHDMDLVRRICPRLFVMETGSELAHGTPEEVLNNPEVITAYLGADDADDDVPEIPAVAALTEEPQHG